MLHINKKKLVLLLVGVLWISTFTIIFSGSGVATSDNIKTLILRPMASGFDNRCQPIGYDENWECVNEVTADDDTTYVKTPESFNYINNDEELYNIQNHTTETGAINSVKVYCRAYHDDLMLLGNLFEFKLCLLQDDSSNNESSSDDYASTLGSNSWVTISHTWTQNPWTSSAWTWHQIDNLEIGTHFEQMISPPEEAVKVTQMYLEVTYYEFEPDVPLAILADLDINPDTFNLKSRRKWITCFLELPEDYEVDDIDVTTILLNEQIPVKKAKIGDYDGDGISDLKVKFKKQVLKQILEPGDEVKIVVTGELTDGTFFEGSDTIKVINNNCRNIGKKQCKN